MRYQIDGHYCILHRSRNCGYVDGKTDLDHVKTRGSGGTDDKKNLMPLCRKHHSERHTIGRKSMARKYSSYRSWLEENAEK